MLLPMAIRDVITIDSTVTNLQPAFGDMSLNGIPAADDAFLNYGP